MSTQAIVVNRETGQIKTVPVSDLETIGSQWVCFCREPEDIDAPTTATEEKPTERGIKNATLKHRHDYGRAADGCPTLPNRESWKSLEMPPAEDWTPQDLTELHDVISRWFQDGASIWTIDMQIKYGKPRTKITVENAWSRAKKEGPRARYPHAVELEYAGVPNAATLTWFIRQGTRYSMAVAVGPNSYLIPPRVEKTPRPKAAAQS